MSDLARRTSATSRTSRSRGSCSRTSRRCCSTPTRCRTRSSELADWARPLERRLRGRRRGARVHPRRGDRARAGRRLRAGAQAGQAARTRRSRPSTSSSTASTRWRCTPTRSPTARACCSTTTCWPPAARRARWPSWSRAPARGSRAARSWSSSRSWAGASGSRGYDVHALLSYERVIVTRSRTLPAAPERGVGRGRRPARAAALVAAGRARGGGHGGRLDDGAALDARPRRCGPTGGSTGRRRAASAGVGAGDRRHAVREGAGRAARRGAAGARRATARG